MKILNNYKKNNIIVQLISLFILIGIVPMIAIILLYNVFSNEVNKDITLSNMHKSNTRIDELINQYINSAEDLVLDIATDDQIYGFLESIPSDEKEETYILAYKDVFLINPTIEDILIFSLDKVNDISLKKGFFEASITLTSQDWYRKTKANPERINIGIYEQNYSYLYNRKTVLTLSKILYKKSAEQVGILLIDLDFDNIIRSIKNELSKDSSIFIIQDENGQIMYSSKPEKSAIVKNSFESNMQADQNIGEFNAVIEGKGSLVAYDTSELTKWKIIYLQPESEAIHTSPYWPFIIAAAIWILIALLIIWLYAVRVKRRLNDYNKKISLAIAGKYNEKIDPGGFHEAKELGDNINALINNIKNMVEKTNDEHVKIRLSELKMLQIQINPHFLYNTMDSIVWLAEDGNLEQVITMTLALARFYRFGLSRGKDVITISEEIEHIRNYLIIQSTRYMNKFQYLIDIDQVILEYNTPKFILQPIVENAIYHGINKTGRKGIIKISGTRINNMIKLEVKDNGIGITKEGLDKILKSFGDNAIFDKDSSFGMKNVNERIQLLFGKKYGLKVYSEFEKGTKIEIWLPITKEGQ